LLSLLTHNDKGYQVKYSTIEWISRNSAIILAVCGALFALCVASNALAVDNKTLPGQACTGPWPSSDGIYANSLGSYNSNESNKRESYCPILRDDTTQDEITDFEVKLYDGNDDATAAGTLECWLYHVDEYGTSVSEYQSTSLGYSGYITFDFGSGPSNSYGEDATYMLRCALPEHDVYYTYLYSYWWSE